MKRQLFGLGLFLALLLGSISVSFAGTYDRVIPAGETVSEDVTVTGEALDLDGTVNGSVFVSGGDADIDGTINGDLTVFGGEVTVTGDVNGTILLFGGDLELDGTVSGDLVLFGGDLDFEGDPSDISGDCVLVGGGVSGGDTGLTCEVLGQGIGDVANFAGPADAPQVIEVNGSGGFGSFVGNVFGAIGSSILLGLIALGVGSIFPRHLENVRHAIKQRPLASGIVGGLTGVAAPSLLIIVMFILLITIIGIILIPFVAIAAGLALVMAALIGWVAMGDLAGNWIVRRTGINSPGLAATAALGTAALTLGVGLLDAVSLGFLSTLIVFVGGLLGFGAATLTKLGARAYPQIPRASIADDSFDIKLLDDIKLPK